MANVLTVTRLLLIPVFIYFLAVSDGDASPVAGIIFAVASATDWLDGQVARRTGRVTEFGKIADPLADRLLIGSAIIILLVQGRLPAIGIMAVLFRDAFLMAGHYVLSRHGIRISVIFLGKLATATLMASLFLYMLGLDAAQWLFWAGVALSLASGAAYSVKGVRQLRRPRPEAAG